MQAFSDIIKQEAQIFNFEGLWGMPSKCGLRMYQKNGQTIVIVTELYKENPGTAIAEVSASLAMQIAKANQIPVSQLVYIEHNPSTHSKLSFYDEEFFLVRFTQDNGILTEPDYQQIEPQALLNLIS